MSDLDELVTTERVRSVFEAREQVKEDERTLREAIEMGRVNDARARRLWKGTIDAYIHELEGLLNPPDDEPSEYWADEVIGAIQHPQGGEIEVTGLAEFLQLNSQITFEIEELDSGRYYEISTPTKKRVTVHPPWDLLQRAFYTADEARVELGMELDAGDEDRAEIGEDLIEEVEEWRKANI